MSKIVILIISIILSINFSVAKTKKPKKTTIINWVEPKKPKIIFGNWQWLETDCCGIRHGISTPLSTNDNINLYISENNTFTETHTNEKSIPRNGNFMLFKQNGIDMIQFNDERPAQYSISTNNDTLTISWKYLELQTEKYIRKN